MTERVLVVDDSYDVRDLVSLSVLKPGGYDILTAGDGQTALELAIQEKPDLIITDMQMPGMTGLELITQLRQQDIKTPTILMTAYGSEETAVEAFRLGARDYIIKPFQAREMQTAVERALREKRLQAERDQLVAQLSQSNLELERRLQEINALYRVGQSVSASLDIELVLQRVVEAAVHLTRAEEGSLMLLDENRQDLYIRASKNMDSEAASMRLRVQDSLAGQVIQSQKPLVLNDDARWHKIKTAYLVRSLIYVPLVLHNQTIGVLSVANRTKKSSVFDRRDTRILSALAGYAVIAIHNANLYTEAQQKTLYLEDALAKLKQLDQMKSEFIQNVSHELRTPLAIAYGYTELIFEGSFGDMAPDLHQAFEIIRRRINMLIDIVDDLTVVLSNESLKMKFEEINLTELVKTMLSEFQASAQEANLTLHGEIAPALPTIIGDPAHIRRVIDNLVSNAMKFTPVGGRIWLRLFQDAGHLALEVSDTGIGIPEDKLDHIFERFYQIDGSTTRRYGGTGLGLALVKEITEAHGGEVRVTSEVGKGTTFRVKLPLP